MGKSAVENLFEAMYNLVEVRKLFRETSPTQNLSESQREELEWSLEKVRNNLEMIEREMLG